MKILQRLARLTAQAAVIAFVATLPPALVMRAAAATLFDPDTVTRIVSTRLVESGQVQSVLLRQLLPGGGDAAQQDGFGALTVHLTDDDWDRLAELVLPAAWLTGEIGSVAKQLDQWLDSDRLDPQLAVNFEPVKRRMLGSGSRQFIEVLFGSWPACSANQEQAMAAAFDQGSQLPPVVCAPSEPLASLSRAQLATAFQNYARQLPSQLSLSELGGSESAARLLEVKQDLNALRLALRAGVLLPLTLFGLIMVLAIRSRREAGLWWGVPLMIAGALTLALGTLAALLQPQLTGWLGSAGQVPPVLANLLQSLAEGLVSAVYRRIWLFGGPVFLFGVVMYVIGRLGRQNGLTAADVPSEAPSRGMFGAG